MITDELTEGCYYRINGTKKILYWNGEKWMEPAKDRQGRYGSYIRHIEKQPNNIKTIQLVDVKDIMY
jgi:hypothetical protein